MGRDGPRQRVLGAHGQLLRSAQHRGRRNIVGIDRHDGGAADRQCPGLVEGHDPRAGEALENGTTSHQYAVFGGPSDAQ
jgi:hypothetical protein